MRSLIVAAVAALALTGCGGEDGSSDSASDKEESKEPTSFDISGFMDLRGAGGWSKGDRCSGSDGYDDMSTGAGVTIYDASSKAIAIGNLKAGETIRAFGTCRFEFVVEDVPKQEGSEIYSIEVSHRGKIQFTEDEASFLMLTLG